MRNESGLLEALFRGEVLQIIALPFSIKGLYADVGLVTDIVDVKVFSEGEDLPSGKEVFHLDLDVFDPTNSWVDKDGVPAWPAVAGSGRWNAVDLAGTLSRDGAAGVLGTNRKVRFFRRVDPAHARPARGLLHSAAALIFEGEPSSAVFAIYASPNAVCSVELTWDSARINEIVSSLEEFDPRQS